MALIDRHMPVLARASGSWVGTYTEVDLAHRIIDRYRFAIDISFPDEGKTAYRQHTRYAWEDGRTQALVFDAELILDRGPPHIAWDHEVMFGTLFEVDDRTLNLRFAYRGGEAIEVQEAMFISADGAHRMRTWHWFKDGEPYRTTLVEERRG